MAEKRKTLSKTQQMNTDAEFDLKAFQSEVFKEFNRLKATIGLARFQSEGYASPENFEEFFDDSTSSRIQSLFFRGILKFFSFLGKHANKHINKPDFIEKERKAKKITTNPKARNTLRRAIKSQKWNDLFLEAQQVKLVKIVTASLIKDKIIDELSIEKDVQLFALIAIKIWQRDVEKY